MRQYIVAAIIVSSWTGCALAEEDLKSSESLPLLEDVKPTLKPGEVWMGLADSQTVVFQGDQVTVPIKLAIGEGDRKPFQLLARPIFKTGQSAATFPTLSHHWINGYTSNGLKVDPKLANGILGPLAVGELSNDLPLTKYFRLAIPPNTAPGAYIIQFEVKSGETTITKNFKLAVHDGVTFSEPELNAKGKNLEIVVRDRFGSPTDADAVQVQLKNSVITATKIQNEVGRYAVRAPASSLSAGSKLNVTIEGSGMLKSQTSHTLK